MGNHLGFTPKCFRNTHFTCEFHAIFKDSSPTCPLGYLVVKSLLIHTLNCFSGMKIGQHTAVRYGENATLFSKLTDTGESLTRIIWRKKTREDPEEKSFFVIFPDGKTKHLNGLKDRIQFIGDFSEKIGSVQIQEMRILDEGIYTCIFNLFPSGPFETNINVTVLGMMLCLWYWQVYRNNKHIS